MTQRAVELPRPEDAIETKVPQRPSLSEFPVRPHKVSRCFVMLLGRALGWQLHGYAESKRMVHSDALWGAAQVLCANVSALDWERVAEARARDR